MVKKGFGVEHYKSSRSGEGEVVMLTSQIYSSGSREKEMTINGMQRLRRR